MSLYDDVEDGLGLTNPPETDQAAKNDPVAGWSNNSSFKLLQHQIEAAKRRQQSQMAASQAKREKMASAAPLAPVIDLSDKRKNPQEPGKQPLLAKEINSPLSKSQQSAAVSESRFNPGLAKSDEPTTSLSMFGGIKEEYDPMKPNDYEQLVEELTKAKKREPPSGRSNEESRSSRQRDGSDEENRRRSDRDRDRHRSEHSSRSSGRHHGRGRSSDEEEDRDKSSRRRGDDRGEHDSSKRPGEEKRQSSAAFAPPPSLVEADSQSYSDPNQEPSLPRPTKTLFGGLMKAEKMMARMGYKEGEGLGRNNQGMAMALQVEKTGKRSGRIIHEKDAPPEPPAATPTTPTQSGTAPAVGISPEVMKNMSKVILLRNMVGPGDVDDDLEGETKEECQKYGEVSKVIIFEIPGVTPEEAVRIFVEFKTLPSAIKALTDLNGRFFGGRVVNATFYNLDKFNKLELGEDV